MLSRDEGSKQYFYERNAMYVGNVKEEGQNFINISGLIKTMKKKIRKQYLK